MWITWVCEFDKFAQMSVLISINIITFTYSMEQSPSWEANSLSASQEIPRI
jgi:hypothetical protein